MDWINKMHMITEKMKNQMHSKGIDSLDKVFIAIAQFDSNGYGYVDKVFFENFLSKIGVFLKSQELTEIHKFLKTSECGDNVPFENLINILKCEVPESFTKIVCEVFDLIQDGNGVISVQNLKNRVKIDHHHRVKLMLKDQEMIKSELNISINFVAGDKDVIDVNEFLEMHRNMYWVTPRENITYLFNMVPELWGCKN
jgi:Ca2+-binding EF-hand superfamily protein